MDLLRKVATERRTAVIVVTHNERSSINSITSIRCGMERLKYLNPKPHDLNECPTVGKEAQ